MWTVQVPLSILTDPVEIVDHLCIRSQRFEKLRFPMTVAMEPVRWSWCREHFVCNGVIDTWCKSNTARYLISWSLIIIIVLSIVFYAFVGVRTVLDTFCFLACPWSVHTSMHTSVIIYEKFVNTISYKLLWEFCQIYNFGGAVGDRDELIGFWSQKVKGQGQGHSETRYGQKSAVRCQGPFSCILWLCLI